MRDLDGVLLRTKKFLFTNMSDIQPQNSFRRRDGLLNSKILFFCIYTLIDLLDDKIDSKMSQLTKLS